MSHYVLVHTEEGLYLKGPTEPYRRIDPAKSPVYVRLELFKKGRQYSVSFYRRKETDGGNWVLDLPYLDVGQSGGSLQDALVSARNTVHLRYGDQQDAGDEPDEL